MSNDDSRDNQTPDRQDESTPTDHDLETVAARLERLDHLTRTLLADIRDPRDTPFESLPPEARERARRHVLEVRSEASQLGILAIGPEAAIPYRPEDDPDDESDSAGTGGGGSPPRHRPPVSVYGGPAPGALKAELERTPGEFEVPDVLESESEGETEGETERDDDADSAGESDPDPDPESDPDAESDSDPDEPTDDAPTEPDATDSSDQPTENDQPTESNDPTEDDHPTEDDLEERRKPRTETEEDRTDD